jgi:pimeloyl-ACP methyl ester carboxylesterase
MTFLIVLASGVLVVVLVHLVVGWLVSRGLYRDALAVRPRDRDLAVRVREVSPDRIVLEAPGPRWDIGHPGTLGLAWEHGYGRLGDVIDVEGSRFIRHYEPVRGTPTPCRGSLDECPPVEVDPFAFPSDPNDVGLAFEAISYPSPIGPMGAWFVPGGSPEKWAVLCHGWTAEKRELIRMLPVFHEAGFNTLVIDYRNDPDAPPDVTGRYRFGLSEWEDLEAAVGLTIERGAGEIVVGGCSTGGALVMAFLERSRLAGSVSAAFLDSPNIVLAEAIRHGTRHLRATPLMIEFGMWIADMRWKVDWEATNYVARAGETLRVPTLVFHGTSDQTIPISISRQLEARAPGMVELVETPAAGHVMSWNADPARYEQYLRNFLERV